MFMESADHITIFLYEVMHIALFMQLKSILHTGYLNTLKNLSKMPIHYRIAHPHNVFVGQSEGVDQAL